MRIIRGLFGLAVVLGILVSPVATAQSEWLPLPGASHMAIRGDYAYIRGWRMGGNDVLYIVDRTNMRLVSETAATAHISQIMTLGSSYVVTREGFNIVVYDVSTPEAPVRVSESPIAGGPVAVSGHYLYRPRKYSFQVYDFSDPANPARVGEYISSEQIPGTPSVLFPNLVAVNAKLFDVSDPTRPVLLESTLPPLPAGAAPYSLPVVVGNYLYRAIFKEQERTPYLRTVDISSPESPLELEPVPLPYDSWWGKLVTDGTYLYFGYEISGQGKWLQVYSAGQGMPRKLGPPIEVDRLSEYLSVVDRTLYIAHDDFGFGGLRIPLSVYYNTYMPIVHK